MGRDWLYWGGGSGGGGGGRSSSSSTKRANNSLKEGLQRGTPSGCMSAVFQLFDFHQLQFCLHKHDLSPPTFDPHHFLIEEQPNVLKGLEAPRNSLEMEGASSMEATNSKEEEEEALNIIPMAIQIKTSTTTTNGTSVRLSSSSSSSKARTDQDMSSSECSTSSPGGSKTPSLVARLMGLDLLPPPGSSSPSPSTHSNPPPSSKSPHLQYLKQEFQNRQRINQLRSGGNNRNGRYSADSADVLGTRSLPDTPRTSASSSRRSVESRLSLQINKENIDLVEFSGTRSAGRRRQDVDDGANIARSPSHYARQIVKQVKERVGRKVGADITNRTCRDLQDVRTEDNRVVVLKAKKPSRLVVGEDHHQHLGSPSCSPRLKLLEVAVKNKVYSNPPLLPHSPRLPHSPLSVQVDAPPVPPPQQPPPPKETPAKPRKPECTLPEQKCKKVERYGARLKKKKQEEQFVRSSPASRSSLPDQKKKSKKTPLSSELLNINFPVKKDSSSRKLQQAQLSQVVSDTFTSERSARLSNYSYKEETSSSTRPTSSSSSTVSATRTHATRGSYNNGRRTPTGGGGGADHSQYFYCYNYIREMLGCTGINVNTPVSSLKCWYYTDPARPLDPPIFDHLERTCPVTDPKSCTELSQRCNRRLIFDVTNEILSKMLRPRRRSSMKPRNGLGLGLIEVICTRIASFPAADCRVLEDIDALIETDFTGSLGFEEDEEDELIVTELENELVDSLIQETAMWVVFGGGQEGVTLTRLSGSHGGRGSSHGGRRESKDNHVMRCD